MQSVHEFVKKNPKLSHFFLTLIVILLFYQCRRGLNFFNPTYINWLINDVELANGFFSFNYFRHQSWGFPLGKIDYLFYPLGTNLYATDIPLLALLFKPFSAILPSNFQYIGIWYLVCHLLQGWFAILLCERFGIKGLTRILAVVFLLFTPVLMSRFQHPTLFCQWMILAGFWIYFIDPEKTPVRKILLYQLCLFLVSGLEFAYVWVFVFGFSVALLLRLWLFDRKIKFYQALFHFSFHSAIMVLFWVLIGLLSLEGMPSYQMAGWGDFSMNLNSLYNAMGTSALLPSFPYFLPQQLEGYTYLGAGILLLVVACIVFYLRSRYSGIHIEKNARFEIENINVVPLLLYLFFSALYALSNKVTFNQHILFQYGVSDMFSFIVNSFRASGRFFWVSYYFILLILFYYINRLIQNEGIRNVVLASCLVLQLYDIQIFLKPIPMKYEDYKPPINTVAWEKLIKSFDAVLFYPGYRRSYLSGDDYRFFTYYATEHQKKINVGYPARYDQAKVNETIKDLGNKIIQEGLDDHTLYISLPPYLDALVLPLYNDEAYCFSIDGYLAIFKKTKSSKALADFLEQPGGNRKLDNPSLLLFARPMFDLSEVPLTKNARMGFYETNDSEGHFYLKGWAFNEDTNGVSNDSLCLVLQSSSNEKWIAPISRFETPDVADYFKRPDLTWAGFGVGLVKNNLRNGAYRAGLLFINKVTKLKSLYRLDYTIEVNKTVDPVVAERPPQRLSELNFSSFTIEQSPGNIRIQGWAFPKKGNRSSCKSYFTLSSPSSFYVAEATIVQRPDVVTFFGDQSLLRSGLDVTFRKTSLAKDSYKLGILLKDTVRQIDYFSETDRLVHVGTDEFAMPERLTFEPKTGTDSIRAFVDKIEDHDDFIQINGWAFINSVSTDFSETYVVLKSKGYSYSITPTVELRKDIQDYFKLSYKVDLAGFKVKFQKVALKPGGYQVCIVMINKKTNIKSMQCLETAIKI